MKLVNPEELKEKLENEKSLVMYFSTQWCGPCKTLSPIVENVSKEFTTEVIKIDLGVYPELANEFNVKSVPTIVYLKNKNEMLRTIGLQPEEKIKENFKLVKTISQDELSAAQIASDEHE